MMIGYESFLAFARTEFNSEAVLFWRRVQEYRESSLLRPVVPLSLPALSGVDMLPHTLPFGASPSAPPMPSPPSQHHELLQQPTPQSGDTAISPTKGVGGSVGGGGRGSARSPIIATPPATAATAATAARNTVDGRADSGLLATMASAAPPSMAMSTLGSVEPDISPAFAQHQLLSSLIEANSIYAYYIDIGAPNELNLSRSIRGRVRSTIDSIMLRAATVKSNIHIGGTLESTGSSSLTPLLTPPIAVAMSLLPTLSTAPTPTYEPPTRGALGHDGSPSPLSSSSHLTPSSPSPVAMLASSPAPLQPSLTTTLLQLPTNVAIHNNNRLVASSQQQQPPMMRRITRKGVSISTDLTVEEACALGNSTHYMPFSPLSSVVHYALTHLHQFNGVQ
jgi:hypothetical protein